MCACMGAKKKAGHGPETEIANFFWATLGGTNVGQLEGFKNRRKQKKATGIRFVVCWHFTKNGSGGVVVV